MDAQAKAGFLKDVSADVAGVEANMAPTAVDSIKVDGKAVGVPFDQGVVSFFYNKKLFEKAGVKAEDIKSWDDLLGRGEERSRPPALLRSRSEPARNGRCTSTIPIL